MTSPRKSKAHKRKTSPPPATEQQEEYDGVIEPDPLLKEVGEANERIADPRERERVVPSRPC